ncbi:MAG: beta-lactamase family protein [Armatimonadetes bacterium]|nr:beta-lactamase family protein [Armatimonadota bacterium]MBS1711905.1 beta-lactamase family protein [Armatimonadota bacterium]MBX3109541.1 beta-lactamase family protein [Fimbriimonadaceae bacterium]
MSTEIESLLSRYIAERSFPGAAYCFGNAKTLQMGWVGQQTYAAESPAVSEGTWWDLASVTKVMSTTMAAICAVRQELFRLDDPVELYLPETKVGTGTVRNLLLHNCGFKAYDSMAGKVSDASEAKTRILTAVPAAKPGEQTTYSCLGFVNLMAVIERSSGTNLGAFIQDNFYGPLGIQATYRPSPALVPHCAPTEATPAWRKQIARNRGEEWTVGEFIQGSVHDPIAYILGGLSGNAGLFAPIGGVAKFGQALAANHEIFGGLLESWVKRQGQSTRALGFDTKSSDGSSAGSRFGPNSYGHTGYTGTCIWVDPDAKIFAALLTNRVHPDDTDSKIAQARPAFFDLAFDAAMSLGH